MQSHSTESPDLGFYFTPENLLVFENPILLDDLVHQLMLNLAITIGIGHIGEAQKHYLLKHKQYQVTLVGPNLMLLHLRLTVNGAMHMSIGVLKDEIISTPPLHLKKPGLFFLIITPHNRPDLFYRVFAPIKQLSENSNLLSHILQQSSTERIWEIINDHNLQLSPYVVAYQIMLPPHITVTDTDNLESAIDHLVMHHSRCLPVVDKDNELIGEVSLEEILQVCFPRHILWMNDISPILHFETFRNLLNNEAVTWLTEILNHRVATVQYDEPAVKATLEMTKLNTDHVYVLNNKTLVGVITLKNMANMILRQ